MTTTITLPNGIKGMGWLRDHPDVRDYPADAPQVRELLAASGSTALARLTDGDAPAAAPSAVDLRAYFSPVEDQASSVPARPTPPAGSSSTTSGGRSTRTWTCPGCSSTRSPANTWA